MTDDQLQRYARHLLLDGFGIEAQQRLLAAHVLVVGAGGLGSPVALYLAAAGVGRLTIVDGDTVDLTNLQRQIAHRNDRIGQAKAASAGRSALELNPEVDVRVVERRADADELDRRVAEADLVIDCSDNFETRQAVNRACVRHRRPLVFGAAIGFDGQASVFDARDGASPCYACLFPPDRPPPASDCATMGVLAPLVGIVGSLQAAEALKLIGGAGHSLVGRLLMVDARTMEWTEIRVRRRADCPICAVPRPSAAA